MKFHPLKSYVLNPVTLDMDAGTFTATIMAEVTNMEKHAVVDAIVRLAKERGITNLYLVDERFALDALQEKMEREEGSAVDAVPVVHARWHEDRMYFRCSNCKSLFTDELYYINGVDGVLPKYCPECGAKMDGGAEVD